MTYDIIEIRFKMHTVRNIFLIIIIAVFLSGCSLAQNINIPGFSDSGNGQEEITLTYWGLWESEKILAEVLGEYKKIKPNVTIVYERRSHQQYRSQLSSQIPTGKGPDIFRFHNTWTPMLETVLEPVPKNILSNSDFNNNFYPTVIKDLRNSEGKFIGVPLEIDGLGLYWNVDIFRAAGVQRPPATWQELSQTAARLTVKDSNGSIDTAGIALGTATNIDHFSDILGLMILQNGGDPASPNDKKAADALEFYTNFATGNNRVWDSTMPKSTSAFARGNVAMYFGPSWRVFEILDANPLLNFQIIPVPQLEGTKVAWASYWVEGVSNQSQHTEEAWEFLKFLQEESSLINIYSQASSLRKFGEPYPKPSLASKITSDPDSSPYLNAFLSDAPFMTSFPMASRTFDQGLNEGVIKAYEDAVTSVLSGQPPATALETTARSLGTILERYNAR